MKKVTRIIGAVCMMALLTFVSTSCKKDQENGEVTISVSVPDIETVNADRAYITMFGKFMWHENDFIRVYNLADEDNAILSKTSVYSKIGNATVPTARFRGPSLGARQAEGYRIFYPYGMVKGTDEQIDTNLWNANHQTFVVAKEQQYHSYEADGHHFSMVDPAAMPMAQYMDKLTDNATLMHLFGVGTLALSSSNETTVIDSVKITDKTYNLTGEVSLKLHKVYSEGCPDGSEYDLNNAWTEFYTNYKQISQEYVENVLMPLYEYMDYEVNYSTVGKSITLNCIVDGQGVALKQYPDATYFNFMLRPLALYTGFDVVVYVHNGEPIELTTDPVVQDETTGNMRGHFKFGASFVPDYQWAISPAERRIYTAIMPIN